MKYLLKYVVALFVVFLTSCSSTAQESRSIAKDVDVIEFKQIIEQKDSLQILDVRTPKEWSSGIIENADTINWNDKDFDKKVVSRNRKLPVVVYCAVGGRSGRAMKKMHKLGFLEVYNLSGGMKAWKKAGNKIIK
jgi:rhodanese-related sulfurtransferase